MLNNDHAGFVNVVGDWIYYSNFSDDDKIYKMRTDGTERTKLNDDDSEYINIASDWIYYEVGSVLYMMRKDGSDRQLVN